MRNCFIKVFFETNVKDIKYLSLKKYIQILILIMSDISDIISPKVEKAVFHDILEQDQTIFVMNKKLQYR